MDWTELDGWLAGLQLPFPMQPQQHDAHAAEIAGWLAAHPEAAGGAIEALLWIRIGHLDPAHTLVQHATRGLEAYVHGVIHRIEGDFWNSKYWFRQVQSPSLVDRIASTLQNSDCNPLKTVPYASPTAFVDACESADKNKSLEALRHHAHCEWEALLRVASDRDGRTSAKRTE